MWRSIWFKKFCRKYLCVAMLLISYVHLIHTFHVSPYRVPSLITSICSLWWHFRRPNSSNWWKNYNFPVTVTLIYTHHLFLNVTYTKSVSTWYPSWEGEGWAPPRGSFFSMDGSNCPNLTFGDSSMRIVGWKSGPGFFTSKRSGRLNPILYSFNKSFMSWSSISFVSPGIKVFLSLKVSNSIVVYYYLFCCLVGYTLILIDNHLKSWFVCVKDTNLFKLQYIIVNAPRHFN